MGEHRGVIPAVQRLWRWSSASPNGRLAAFAIATPVATFSLLCSLEGVMMATVGHTLSESEVGVPMLIFGISGLTPFVVVPFGMLARKSWQMAGESSLPPKAAPSTLDPAAPNRDAPPYAD